MNWKYVLVTELEAHNECDTIEELQAAIRGYIESHEKLVEHDPSFKRPPGKLFYFRVVVKPEGYDEPSPL